MFFCSSSHREQFCCVYLIADISLEKTYIIMRHRYVDVKCNLHSGVGPLPLAVRHLVEAQQHPRLLGLRGVGLGLVDPPDGGEGDLVLAQALHPLRYQRGHEACRRKWKLSSFCNVIVFFNFD